MLTSLLPRPAQLIWMRNLAQQCCDISEIPFEHKEAWASYQSAGEKQKHAAMRAFKILMIIHTLQNAGWRLDDAIHALKSEHKISRPTILRWKQIVKKIPHEHWLAYLLPGKTGPKSPHFKCSDDAWAFIKSEWFRPKKPTLSASYLRVQRAAERHGWIIPSKRTFARWLAQLPKESAPIAHDDHIMSKAHTSKEVPNVPYSLMNYGVNS